MEGILADLLALALIYEYGAYHPFEAVVVVHLGN